MFYMAEKLGMTVDELGNRMSSLEFAEWIAYQRIVAHEQDKVMKEAELKAKMKKH